MIRQPVKKTSKEKKQRIIQRGFCLMCEKGYHNVTCIDIAHYSDVSTGIIYQYFKDKRDIFICGIKDYSDNIIFPMIDVINSDLPLKDILNQIIDKFILTHKANPKAHEELLAMSHLDNEIAEIFHDKEMIMTEKISKILENKGLKINNIKEKVHIIYDLIDNYAHEVVYHKHKQIDYEIMKEEVINMIIFCFKKRN